MSKPLKLAPLKKLAPPKTPEPSGVKVEAPKTASSPTKTEAPKTTKPLPKAASPKAEIPKATKPLAKLSKTEVPKAASPKPSVTKTEVPKAVSPKSVASKTASPKSVASKVASPKPSTPKAASPKSKVLKAASPSFNNYFPNFNGVDLDKVKGSQDKMFTLKRSGEIVNHIVQKMKEYGKPIPFSVILNDNTESGLYLTFLKDAFSDNPNISSLTIYESNPKAREMLNENISLYSANSKVQVSDQAFNGVEKDVSNKVLLLDKFDENWIQSCPHCSMIVVVTPDIVPEIYGFQQELSNEVYIFRPTTELRQANLKNLSIEKQKQREAESAIWRDNLRNFLRKELLPRAVTSESVLDQLTNDENMKIWEIAFTSEDYSPSQGENWEELELIGDRLLGYLFTKFLMESFPTINRGEISVFIQYYLAKPFLAKKSGELGMNRHIRSRLRSTIHMFEDVFESTFGAIVKAGDSIKNGVGVGLAYNLFVSIFEGVDLDWEVTLGNPKTRVKEIFETMGWIIPQQQEKVPEEFFERDGMKVFQVLFNNVAINQLKFMGVDIQSKVLAESVQTTKKKASDDAYAKAIRNLQKIGITEEWVKEFRNKRDFDNADLQTYVEAANKRLFEEGYVRFYFEEIRGKDKIGGDVTGKYIQMIGVDLNGKKKVLAMSEEALESTLLGKQMVLSDYANYIQ